MGIPVVIASNGRGICVRNVTSGAPVMTVATNGFGIPIVLGTKGIPFVVQGGGTPTPTPTPSASLRAPLITPQASATTFPPAPAYTFYPDASAVGDTFRIWAAPTYADALARTNLSVNQTVVLTGTYATDKAAINAKLAGIASGTSWISGRIERSGGTILSAAAIPIKHGTNAVPTVLSSLTPTVVSTFPLAYTLNLSEPGYVELLGDDRVLVELVGAQPGASFTLRFLNNAVKNFTDPVDFDDFNGDRHYDVGFNVTGLQGAVALTTIDLQLLDFDITPDAFTFTPASGVAQSSTQTSNEIEILNIDAAAVINVTVSGGTMSKNGGSYSSTATTAVLHDKFRVRRNAGPAYNDVVTVTLTAGGVSATYTVTVMADPSASSLTVSATAPYTHDFGFGNGGTIALGTHAFDAGDWIVVIETAEQRGHTACTIGGVSATQDAYSSTAGFGDGAVSAWRVPAQATGGNQAVVLSVDGSLSLAICQAFTGQKLGNVVAGSFQANTRGFGHTISGGGFGEVASGPVTISGGRLGVMVVMSVVDANYTWTGANPVTPFGHVFKSNAGVDMNSMVATVPATATPQVAFNVTSGYPLSGYIAFVWEKVP